MILTLPLPPSVNQCWANRRGAGRGRYRTRVYEDWRQQASLMVLLGRAPKVTGPYKLTIGLPAAMRGDVDNRIKPISDLLVDLRITPDDRHCQGVSVVRDENVFGDQCEVKIEAA